MRAVTLERRTRTLVRLWTAASIAAAGAALLVASAAGGTSQWTRWLLGLVSVYGFAGASRFRFGLQIGAYAGVAMIAVVPQDATIDRVAVAAIGAVLVMLACELAHVARRLVTIAPVESTRLDVRAVGMLAATATMAAAVTALVAHLDRWNQRLLIVGLAVAGAAMVAMTEHDATGRARRTRRR